MADGWLNFKTKLDESGFNSGISKLGGLASKGFAVVSKAVVGVSAAMGAGVIAGLKYNATIEGYQTSFEVMTGSAEKAKQVVEDLKKLGASTPFELKDLAETTQLLMNYGMTADDAQKKLSMLGDIAQGDAEKMKGIATAYGQMSSAGKVSLEDIKQMIERGFNPLQEISESTGESMASLYERISKGTISVDEITASMTRSTSEGGKYFESMKKQSQTFSGQLSTMKDNAMSLLGTLTQPISGFFVEELMPKVNEVLGQLSTAFEEDGFSGLVDVGANIIRKIIEGLTVSLPEMQASALSTISYIISWITGALPQLLTTGAQILTSLASGFSSAISTIIPLISNLCWTISIWIINNAGTFINAGMNILNGILKGIINTIPVIISKLPLVISAITNFVDNQLPQILEKGADIILSLIDGIIDTIPTLLANLPKIINSILKFLFESLPKIIKKGNEITLKLIWGILQRLPEINKAIIKINLLIIQTIASYFAKLVDSGGKVISNFVKGIGQKINDVTAKIKEIVSNIIAKFKEGGFSAVGKYIIDGIINGIGGAVGGLMNKVREVAGNALKAMKNALGIHSPSRVFRDQIGKYIPQGIAVGVDKEMPIATEDMRKSISNSLGTIKTAVNADMSSIGIKGQSTSVASTKGSDTELINYNKLASVLAEQMSGIEFGIELNERTLGRGLRGMGVAFK